VQVGYVKNLENVKRETGGQETGNGKPETGNRKRDTGIVRG